VAHVSQQQILEMECQLLFSKFKNEKTISRVQEKIAVATGGNSIHGADALKLGLQTALRLKKQRPNTGATDGAAPPRSGPICPKCSMWVRRSVLTSAVWCQRCEQTYKLCTKCGSLRDLGRPSCNSC